MKPKSQAETICSECRARFWNKTGVCTGSSSFAGFGREQADWAPRQRAIAWGDCLRTLRGLRRSVITGELAMSNEFSSLFHGFLELLCRHRIEAWGDFSRVPVVETCTAVISLFQSQMDAEADPSRAGSQDSAELRNAIFRKPSV